MGFTVAIADYVTHFISVTGYVTVFFGMVLESMVFPLPSEAVLPFAGFLVAEGRFGLVLTVLVATFGSLIGSLLSYAIGFYGGRPFLNRFGRYFLIDQAELDFTDRFFRKHGAVAVFVSRFIPVVRHLISLPAGMAKMDIRTFSLLTVIGAGIWNGFLVLVGCHLRQNWRLVMEYGKVVDEAVIAIILILVGLFVARYFRKRRH